MLSEQRYAAPKDGLRTENTVVDLRGLALERKDPNGGDPPGRYELPYSEAQPMYEPVAKASGAHKS